MKLEYDKDLAQKIADSMRQDLLTASPHPTFQEVAQYLIYRVATLEAALYYKSAPAIDSLKNPVLPSVHEDANQTESAEQTVRHQATPKPPS